MVVAVHLHRCVDGRSQRPPRDGASAGASTAANSGEIVRQLLSRRVVRFATVSVASVRASQVALAVTFGALGGRAMEPFDLKRASATVVVIVVSLGAFGSLWVFRFLVLDQVRFGATTQTPERRALFGRGSVKGWACASQPPRADI